MDSVVIVDFAIIFVWFVDTYTTGILRLQALLQVSRVELVGERRWRKRWEVGGGDAAVSQQKCANIPGLKIHSVEQELPF